MILDSSAFIAFISPRDSHHSEASRVIEKELGSDHVYLHEVSLAECLVGAKSESSVQKLFNQLATLGILLLDSRGITGALRVARLRQETRCALPDCYVLDAALMREQSLATFDSRMHTQANLLGIKTLTN